MYKLNTTDYGWSEIDDDFILYSTSMNTYYVLNDTARTVWEFLYKSEESKRAEDIAHYLESVYEVTDMERVYQDVYKLIDTFSEMGILTQIE